MVRLAVSVHGIVQGVGFRPFVYNAATARGLSGWVRDRTDGLSLEVEGAEEAVRDFIEVLTHMPPPSARVERIDTTEVPPLRDQSFAIIESAADGAPSPILPADHATCTDCMAEVASPRARRYRYPFTNCTRCGPRYTIIEALPYDRPRTTMQHFPLCPACAAEYDDPSDRRFHAQPIACPRCGPTLQLLSPDGGELARGGTALLHAAAALACGQIVALKGLGGFQLLVAATDPDAVARLRQRKGREDKPFAVMCPSLDDARAVCVVSVGEAAALCSAAAPIVLLQRRPVTTAHRAIAAAVAPGNPRLGVMLPYTPLHRLLLDAAAQPLVCTSGNLSEEPMCTDNAAALARLGGLADYFLVHDRPIARPVDDSVVRVAPWGLQTLRRARGFAPLPLRLATGVSTTHTPVVLALGGHLKNTIALATDGQALVSQHLGDLASVAGALLLERTIVDLTQFLAVRPALLACDLHPNYTSTRIAERLADTWGVPLERVQHHHAHVAACVAEHGLSGPVLGLAWDGAGLGTDGTLWGGEALVVDGASFRRVAHLRPFPLPGGERAMREPRRAALGLLFETLGADALTHVGGMFSATDARLLLTMLENGVHVVRTTSVGRLFDATAALAGIRTTATFEGQAAMELECAAEQTDDETAYPLPLCDGEPAVADWAPLLRAVLRDRDTGTEPARIAARFHNALAALVQAIADRFGVRRVVLTGGCFQNLRLAHHARARLLAAGFEVYIPQRYPANDGGLALGQLLVALARRCETQHH